MNDSSSFVPLFIAEKMIPEGTKSVKIPKHVIGFDDDWVPVLKKIRHFLLLDDASKKAEKRRWTTAERWERSIYEKRIAVLAFKRQGMLQKVDRERATATVTPPPASGPLEPETPLVEPVREETELDKYVSKNIRSFFKDIKKNNPANRSSFATLRGGTGDENDDDDEEDETLKATSLFSVEEERQKKVAEANALKQQSKRRRVGEHAATLYQQTDQVSIMCLENTLETAAACMDSIYFPDRSTTEPSIKMIVLVLNELERLGTDGGRTAGGNLRAEKPQVIALTRHTEDVRPIMQAFFHCTRREVANLNDNPNYLFVPLHTDKNSGDSNLKKVVTQYIDKCRRSRSMPRTGVASFESVAAHMSLDLPSNIAD